MKIRKNILEEIDKSKDELIKLHQEIIQIPSVNPPGNENLVAEWVKNIIEPMGFTDINFFEVEKNRTNLIAKLPGTEGQKSLVCYSHMDVVPAGDIKNWTVDPFGGEIKDEKIYGRGAADHKAPIPALIMAVKAIQNSGVKLKGDLIFTFVADEEVSGMKGMKPIAEKKVIKADMGIYCSSGNRISIGHNGRIVSKITALGTLTHSAHKEAMEPGRNAIENAAKIIIALQNKAAEVSRRTHQITKRAAMSVTLVNGGWKDNVIPDKCEIILDRRFTPSETIEEAINEIKTTLNIVKEKNPHINYDYELIRTRDASTMPQDHFLVLAFEKIYEEVKGSKPEISGHSGSSDLNYFINDLNIPMVSFGSGDDAGPAHGPDEHISIKDLVNMTKLYALAILDLLDQ
jgi:acetylornithine deacetylase/succinyl-diaminopimelate desuccinylase family protein